MATNINTNNVELSSDIYDVSAFLDEIRRNYIPNVSETASMVGIFGYMNEMFSQSLQNALIVAAETSNETIPTRAKFTKNIVNHAMNYGITDIFAKPASIDIALYLPLSYIEKNFVSSNLTTGEAEFILDRKIPIYIDKYEYHLDYDILITRKKNMQNKLIYTAMYDIFGNNNPLSNITNPYITNLIESNIDGIDYIIIGVRLHQIKMAESSINILTDNNIENKSITFTFEDQITSFDIDIVYNNESTHLIPIYSGMYNNTINEDKWCYYEFIDEYTIRVLFDKESYIPKLNSTVIVNISLCSGSSGNFTYNNTFKTALKSDKYNNYNGMYAIIQPLQNGLSYGGKDKKSISDLKKIIPREISSRGAIINTTDLQNFFNSINDDTCRLYFKKKRDNQFERMYYTYLLMKKDGIIYPTNTLNVKIRQEDFRSFSDNMIIPPGTKFYYYNHGTNINNDYATIQQPTNFIPGEINTIINEDGELVRIFEYISPFLINIDKDLITSYLMTLMDEYKLFKFSYINKESDAQFITSNIKWKRNFINENNSIYDNKYTMIMDVMQNNDNNYNLISYTVDNDGNKIFNEDKTLKIIMVLYTDNTESIPYKYIEGQIYDIEDNIYKFKFTFYTDDYIDINSRIKISGIYNVTSEQFQTKDSLNESYGYMYKNTFAKIFILADFGSSTEENSNNRSEIENIIPTKDKFIDTFLRNKIDGIPNNIISIIKSNPVYLDEISSFMNISSDDLTESIIISYIFNQNNNNFKNRLLQNNEIINIINSYNYIDLNGYTLCNTLIINNGIDFYHDYSNIMRSSISVDNIPVTDEDGNIIYKEISRQDIYGNKCKEYKPIWLTDSNNEIVYDYCINRVPMIKSGFLNSETMMQDYIYTIDERRKYINECLSFIEDTFDIDLKFFNTYGPAKTFYYDIPNIQNYKIRIIKSTANLYKTASDISDIINIIQSGTELIISQVSGQYGYSSIYKGWIKLSDAIKVVERIDNVALSFKFAMQLQSTADKSIINNIINDIKEYIEDISSINELHIPNIITLITNNYRNQLVYFEFLGVNGYNSTCQHLYLDDKIEADVCPEFLNIEINDDGSKQPLIDISVY